MEKNLIFFCAINTDVLDFTIDNINHVYNNISKFDGYKICNMVNIKANEHEFKSFKYMLNNIFDEVNEVKNEPELRETPYFIPAIERIVEKANKKSITFYCHSKGTGLVRSRSAVKNWMNSMYHYNLYDMELIENKFKDGYKCVGIFKNNTKFIQLNHQGDPRNEWCYAGTFSWFDQNYIINMPDYRNIQMTRYGIECYLGCYIKREEAACLYMEDYNCDLYLNSAWHRLLNIQ